MGPLPNQIKCQRLSVVLCPASLLKRRSADTTDSKSVWSHHRAGISSNIWCRHLWRISRSPRLVHRPQSPHLSRIGAELIELVSTWRLAQVISFLALKLKNINTRSATEAPPPWTSSTSRLKDQGSLLKPRRTASKNKKPSNKPWTKSWTATTNKSSREGPGLWLANQLDKPSTTTLSSRTHSPVPNPTNSFIKQIHRASAAKSSL